MSEFEGRGERISTINLPLNRSRLLANVAQAYHRMFLRSPGARGYLTSLGIASEETCGRFQVGYADGSLAELLGGDVRGGLAEAGLLDDTGREVFAGCVVVPVLDLEGACVGFYGKRIEAACGAEDGGDLWAPSVPCGLFNARSLARNRTLIAAGSVLDVLAVHEAGHGNVVGLLDETASRLLRHHRPERLILAMGEESAERWAAALAEIGIPSSRIDLPNGASVAEFIRMEGPAAFGNLVRGASPVRLRAAGYSVSMGPVDGAEDEFDFVFGEREAERRYIARLLVTEGWSMKANLRAVARGGGIHVDTLELYASRARRVFAKDTARLFSSEADLVERDLGRMVERLERHRKKAKAQSGESDGYRMTEDEEAEALAFLAAPDLLDRVARDLETCGYVGEEAAKKIGYLACVSRKLASPLSAVFVSQAGAGKSRLMEELAALCPPEDVVWYTRITPQALYYKDDRSLAHKLIVACEGEGLMGADYSIRELISSKRLRMAAPIRDPMTGRQKTVDYEVEGPVAILFSTEEGDLDPATRSRLFVLSLNESREQTRRILAAERSRKTLAGAAALRRTEEIRRVHRNAQRLLRPLAVVNPHAPDLTFPDHRVTARREQGKYLSLIEAVALLRQHQKPVKVMERGGERIEYIEAGPEDIEAANDLMAGVLRETFEEARPRDRELLSEIQRMVERMALGTGENLCDVKWNRRDVREWTGWSDHQVRASLARLISLQYVIPVAGRRGSMYRYELGVGAPAATGEASPGLADAVMFQGGAESSRKFAPTSRALRGPVAEAEVG